jgi:hypothetical protein
MSMPLFSRVAMSLMVAVALSACGGGPPDADEAATTATPPASNDRPAASTADAPRSGPSVAAVSNLTPPRGSADVAESASAYEIRLFDQNGWSRETFELAPVRGVGYQTLHAAVVLRASKTPSTVAGVQAYCATPLRCEYLLPRSADRAGRYTVSLADDSVARLSTTEGTIVISARHLEVERPSTVSVTLSVDGQPPVTKRITYLTSAG